MTQSKENRIMRNTALLACSSLVFAVLACGGPAGDSIGELDEADLAEDLEYVEGEGDSDPERLEPAGAVGLDAYDAEFELIASSPLFQNYVSRVALVLSPDCPSTIRDGQDVPWRCLTVRTLRHPLVPDVDAMGPESIIRFHRLRSGLSDRERDLGLYGCPTGRQPNGQVDLHTAGVRRFVAAGFYRAQSGQRRYEVLYRRKSDGTYRLVPARPKLDSGEWREIKPNSGLCVPLN
jgi:hypothetical protein